MGKIPPKNVGKNMCKKAETKMPATEPFKGNHEFLANSWSYLNLKFEKNIFRVAEYYFFALCVNPILTFSWNSLTLDFKLKKKDLT